MNVVLISSPAYAEVGDKIQSIKGSLRLLRDCWMDVDKGHAQDLDDLHDELIEIELLLTPATDER